LKWGCLFLFFENPIEVGKIVKSAFELEGGNALFSFEQKPDSMGNFQPAPGIPLPARYFPDYPMPDCAGN
jgi:hypothetical protein